MNAEGEHLDNTVDENNQIQQMFANVRTSTEEPCVLPSGSENALISLGNLVAYIKSILKNNLIVGENTNDFRQAILRMTAAVFLWVC